MIALFFLAKNSRTNIDLWAGALSWCEIHDWFFTILCVTVKLLRAIRLSAYNLLTVQSCIKKSQTTFIELAIVISNPRNTSETRFLVSPTAPVSIFRFFITSILAKRLPFIGVFSFEKSKKTAGAKSGVYLGWGMMIGQKLIHNLWCVIAMQNRWFAFCAFLTNCFPQSAHNFKEYCSLTVRPCGKHS